MVKTRPHHTDAAVDAWLRRYYFTRAAFSIAWVIAAVALNHTTSSVVIAALLLVYPAWDCVANIVDARRNGGFLDNPTQSINAFASAATTAAVAITLNMTMNAVIGVFGVWAALSGLMQLATGIRRWKTAGAQWAMIISGAQSTFAGTHFLQTANAPTIRHVSDIAPYAAFGAFYFLLAALALTVTRLRHHTNTATPTTPSVSQTAK